MPSVEIDDLRKVVRCEPEAVVTRWVASKDHDDVWRRGATRLARLQWMYPMMNREEREAGIERAAAEAREHRRRRSNRPLPNHLDRRVHSHHRNLRGFVRTSAGAEVDYASDITEASVIIAAITSATAPSTCSQRLMSKPGL